MESANLCPVHNFASVSSRTYRRLPGPRSSRNSVSKWIASEEYFMRATRHSGCMDRRTRILSIPRVVQDEVHLELSHTFEPGSRGWRRIEMGAEMGKVQPLVRDPSTRRNCEQQVYKEDNRIRMSRSRWKVDRYQLLILRYLVRWPPFRGESVSLFKRI